jgi:hypothetical protein
MPLQNRVSPYGEIEVSPAKGTLMGNRGCLHDDHKMLTARRWTTNLWMTCLLSFKGRKRTLMTPGKYTELFFLDEATALAAGHRPCAECRRADYRRFMKYWAAASGSASAVTRPADVDRSLHAARVSRKRKKITYVSLFSDLPDGVMLAVSGGAFLKWRGRARSWSFEGYGPQVKIASGDPVTVLTPRPTVEVIRAGYVPDVHSSVGDTATDALTTSVGDRR